jgi:hypothetical protein
MLSRLPIDRLPGKATFNVMEGKKFSSLRTPSQAEVDLFQNTNRVAEKISVETATLKGIFDKYKKLLDFKRPFLKMDTQGMILKLPKGRRVF